jgi:DNA primase
MSTKSSSFDRTQIEEIKQRINIEDVVKEYVKLKPVGTNLFGLCPFHNEDTPSFSVNSEMGIFKCFGCGESGDVIEFLMKLEGLRFPEAVKQLAQRAGITLKTTSYDKEKSKKYTKALKAHKLATKYFHYILMKHKLGSKARNYVKRRKLNKDAIEKFKIGYAPGFSSNNSLIKFLQKRNFKSSDLVEFGLAKKKNTKITDKFFDRIMFPIFSFSGNIIGFSGRILDSNEKRPKYLNTPQTILFKKRNNLFGIHQAKQGIRKKDFVILVEGSTDVISSWQTGVKNIVAPLGTSITTSQIKKLKRFTRNIALCFDKDNAGFKASMRAAKMAYKAGFNVESIDIPKGKDADECIRIDPKLWKKTVRSKISIITYFLNRLAAKHDLTTLSSKRKIIEFIIPLLETISDDVIQEHHIKEISKKTQISESILEQYLKSPQNKQMLRDAVEKRKKIKESDISLETYLLSVVLQNPRFIDKFATSLFELDLQSQEIKSIFGKLANAHKANTTKKKKVSPKQIEKNIVDNLTTEEQMIYEDAKMRPLWLKEPSEGEIQEEIEIAIESIKKRALQNKIRTLQKEIKRLEELKKNEKATKLLKRLNKLVEKLHSLREN